MTIFWTVLSGVTVFVIGQVLLKMFIDPVQRLREVIAEIAYSLWHDHAIIHNAETVAEEKAKDVHDRLRSLGARLAAAYQLIPFYSRIHSLFGLSNGECVKDAADKLFELSNNMWGDDPIRVYRLDLMRIEICEALGIEDPIKNGLTKEEIIESIRQLRGAGP